MNNFFKVAFLLLFVLASLSCQSAEKAQESISFPSLGFRYTPPAGMVDLTSPSAKEARSHGAPSTNRAVLLLDMSSADGDTAPEWHQVWVFSYPRASLSKLGDFAAESKLNASLAGPRSSPVGQPQNTVLAGRDFVVSEFEQKEPPLIKHAKIFTTINNSQLISLVLVSNSMSQVTSMQESLKTLDFSKP